MNKLAMTAMTVGQTTEFDRRPEVLGAWSDAVIFPILMSERRTSRARRCCLARMSPRSAIHRAWRRKIGLIGLNPGSITPEIASPGPKRHFTQARRCGCRAEVRQRQRKA